MNSEAGRPSLVLTRRAADGTVEWIPLDIPERVPVAAGEHYALIDRAHYEAPQALVARRDGDDLIVEVQDAEVLVLGGFFVTPDVAFHPTTDIAGGAGPFSGVPVTADTPVPPGSDEQVVWSAEPVEEQVAASAEAGEDGEGGGSALLYGGLAAGGLALALAAGGGGGGGGSGGSDPGGDPGSDPSDPSGEPEPDETPPEITSAATAANLDENSGAGQVVYTATATDEGTVTWSLAPGGDAAAFSIDPDTGEVTLNENPDFETRSSYSFTVVATDDAGNISDQTVTLAINDLDDAAPHITSGARATAIDENSGPGQVVYEAEATDDGAVTWSLEAEGDAPAFTIDAATGVVTLNVDPDHETQPSYSFTVVATDTDGNSSRQRVSLEINDLDEVAPTITSGDTAAAIDENSGAGQIVYTVTSTDDGDVATGSTRYSLAPDGDADRFSIDAETGEVTLVDDPDFETKPSYNFTVVATDAAGNSSQQTVTLAINDVDDVASVTVQDIALTGATGDQNGILNAGDTVTVTVTMTEPVNVDTTGGTPRIALAVGDATVFADYVSGSGSTSLIFEYTIQSGENDGNGIGIPPNTLDPNGGAVTDAAGNPADLHHGAVPSHPSFPVDTTAPTLDSSTPADNAIDVQIDENIVLTFSEDVAVGTGTITLTRLGSDDGDDDGDGGEDVITIDVTDPAQVSAAGNQVTIDPAVDLRPGSTYSVQIDDGAFTDAAGNASDEIALNFDTAIDTGVVVFDLVQGVSSDHSSRTFVSDVSYDIYIRVDSRDARLSTDGDGPGTWGTWTGAANLGSDDRVILVGTDEPVQGFMDGGVDRIDLGDSSIAWQSSPFGVNVARLAGSTFTRFTGLDGDDRASVRLFDTTPPAAFFNEQGGDPRSMHFTAMPQPILTSQGLV